MRISAPDIINDLMRRVARLEKQSASDSPSVPSVQAVIDFVNNTRTNYGGTLRFRHMYETNGIKLHFKTTLGSSEYIHDDNALDEWESDGYSLAEEVQMKLERKFPKIQVGLYESSKDIGIWVAHKGDLVIYLDDVKFIK